MPKTMISQKDYDLLHKAFTVELQQNGLLACEEKFSKAVYAASAHDLLQPLYDVRREHQLVVFTSECHYASKHVVEVRQIWHDWAGKIHGFANVFTIPTVVHLVDVNTWEN